MASKAMRVFQTGFSLCRLPVSVAVLLTCIACGTLAAHDVQAAQADSTTSLRPGDVVSLKIWREPDLSGEFKVNEAGMVTVPKLGAFEVTSESPASLQKVLMARYGEFLVNPSIEISILRRITVSGAVRNPGLFTVDPTITVSDAVAMAGGANPDGKMDQVELLRDGRSLTVKLTSGTVLGSTPMRSGDQLFIPQKTWLSRNTWVVATGISATASLILAFTH